MACGFKFRNLLHFEICVFVQSFSPPIQISLGTRTSGRWFRWFRELLQKTITVYVESFFAASIHVFGRLTVRAMDNISWFTVGFKLSYMNLQDSEIEILILNNWNKTINKSEWKQTSGGFLKWWYSQNTPKWSFLVGKPMVVGYHHFWKPPSTLW